MSLSDRAAALETVLSHTPYHHLRVCVYEAGPVDTTEAQVLQQADAWALQQYMSGLTLKPGSW